MRTPAALGATPPAHSPSPTTAAGSSFTPGPWSASKRATRSSNFGDHFCLVHGPDVARVAKVQGGNTDDPRVAEANARLIAGAPELLAALDMFTRVARWSESDHDGWVLKVSHSTMLTAESAVRKAIVGAP